MEMWQGNVVGVLVALAAVGALATAGRRLRSAHRAMHARIEPLRPVDTPLDLYELAYLRGGGRRVAAVALVRMHAEGRLSVRRRAASWITVVPSDEPRDGVEAAVLKALAGQRNDDGWSPWPVELFDSDPPLRDIRERLVLGGLLRDQSAPIGVLHHHPVSRSYYRARHRFARTQRWVPAFAVAGAVVALLWHAYLPLLLYPPLLWAGWRHRNRYDDDTRSFGEVTPAGRAATLAAETARGLATVGGGQIRDVALVGPDALPAQHILCPPPARSSRPPERRPEPPPVVIDGSPGLGGL
ncbi:TIGR04222 domain-containing membrane protein [Streptomyces albipurpureus]|uniref:TIGR04222 domain-containing membrane protein n=1 Tax=Streptomyces albipurpureus TaxID=2897419 RepID=A0ABT0URC1_9ACTN|nr:TIGR04222 domain-containing membrane protein [Streptomyces sp. CWNU-1]MCM2389933.1 TIGR04222 domain-containing membrane protein [Streptomyces sp. CWNU-1]